MVFRHKMIKKSNRVDLECLHPIQVKMITKLNKSFRWFVGSSSIIDFRSKASFFFFPQNSARLTQPNRLRNLGETCQLIIKHSSTYYSDFHYEFPLQGMKKLSIYRCASLLFIFFFLMQFNSQFQLIHSSKMY